MPTILYLNGSKNRITFGVKEFGGPGSGFKNHKGRDATNQRGGSLPRDKSEARKLDEAMNPTPKAPPTPPGQTPIDPNAPVVEEKKPIA